MREVYREVKIYPRHRYKRGQWECILHTPNGRRQAVGYGHTKAEAYQAAYTALYGPAGRVPCALPAPVILIK